MSAIIKTLKTKTDETEQSVYPKTVLEAVVDAETNQTLDVILENLTVGTQSGNAYVDFNEQSGEVTGEVEKVTSASLVDYDNSTSGVVGSNVQEAIDELSNGKVNTSDIVDNLVSTATNLPLSANQGKVLNDRWTWKSLTLNNNGLSYTNIPTDANELDVVAMVRDGVGSTHYFHNVHIINFKSVYHNYTLFDGNTKAYIRINNGTIILTNAYIGDTDVTSTSALVVSYR